MHYFPHFAADVDCCDELPAVKSRHTPDARYRESTRDQPTTSAEASHTGARATLSWPSELYMAYAAFPATKCAPAFVAAAATLVLLHVSFFSAIGRRCLRRHIADEAARLGAVIYCEQRVYCSRRLE